MKYLVDSRLISVSSVIFYVEILILGELLWSVLL